MLRTQGSLDIEFLLQTFLKTFTYVNNTIEVLTTFVHLLIGELSVCIGLYPHLGQCSEDRVG